MSDIVYTDPALAASKEPFNQMHLRQTAAENANMQRKISLTPPRGLPGWVPAKPNGGIRNSFGLVKVITDYAGALKAFEIINDANAAIFKKAKELECNKEFDIDVFYNTKPYSFGWIELSGKDFIKSDTTIIEHTQIKGTNCSIMKDYKVAKTDKINKKVK